MPFIQFQFRRGSNSEWASANTLLANGEMGIENDTRRFKIGDGVTKWNLLPYGGLDGGLVSLAYDTANAAFNQANTDLVIANLAFDLANTVRTTANLAFDTSNTATYIANLGFDAANTATYIANLAFDKANTGTSGTSDQTIINTSSDITITGASKTVFVNTSPGNVTITLPAASGNSGRTYIIKNIDGNTVNIVPTGSDTIDIYAYMMMAERGSSMTVVSDNVSIWWIQ